MPQIGVPVDVPPPPPPPLCAVQPAAGVSGKRWRTAPPGPQPCPRDEVCLLVNQLRHSLSKHWKSPSTLLLLSQYEQVTPLIQDGPMCGLVALCMASSLVGNPILLDTALETARARNYTIQGEMFSATQVGQLASDLCGCRFEVCSGQTNYDTVVQALLNRKVVLVPYDSDRNNEPGQKGGHKAHWAVLSGVLRAFPVSERSNMGDQYVQDGQISNLYHWASSPPRTTKTCKLSGISCPLPRGKKTHKPSSISREPLFVYVFAKQGKSAYTKLWDLADLLDSNKNLFEVGDKIMNEREKYVIPADGIDKTLCDLIVTLEAAKH